jgi:Nitrile hydratase, alpha chain
MAKMTRGEMQDLLAKFSIEDPAYRAALVKNPRAVVEKQFNNSLPANVTVKAVEESATTLYVVVPAATAQVGELDDSDLEKVAGGDGSTKIKGNATCQSGALNTVVSINASLM